MQTITKFLVLLMLAFSVMQMQAQDNENKNTTKKDSVSSYLPNRINSLDIDRLKAQKRIIENEEREFLKAEVEIINQTLERGDITAREAEKMKKAAAKKRALNIENRIAIIENKIELLERNENSSVTSAKDYEGSFIKFGEVFTIGSGIRNRKPKKYDKRTTSDMVVAFGLNNAIVEGESFDDSPYKIGGSRFFEIGWAWKTRVFKNSNFLRIKYGYSFMINGLKPKDNQYFVQDGNTTTLEEFPEDLRKSKLSITNLVFPVHFEFGPSKKIERKTYFRYSTRNQFKMGLGGYAGFNIGTRQKLKYKQDGDRIKDKIKRSYNATSLVYGLSGYVAFDDVALYVKYDLSPIFKDQTVDQNNISVGVRFDMD